MSGLKPDVVNEADMNGDGGIGAAEAIYNLHTISGRGGARPVLTVADAMEVYETVALDRLLTISHPDCKAVTIDMTPGSNDR